MTTLADRSTGEQWPELEPATDICTFIEERKQARGLMDGGPIRLPQDVAEALMCPECSADLAEIVEVGCPMTTGACCIGQWAERVFGKADDLPPVCGDCSDIAGPFFNGFCRSCAQKWCKEMG